jgi:ArsR family transcriptional regulator, arsenate/arsenite/antimonite-responsive transcriptional repressor
VGVFDALAHPTRRRILELLRDRDMTAGELAEHFDVSKPTLSGHFAKLRDADLILAIRDGTSIIYSLNLSVVEDALMGLLARLGSNGAHEPDHAAKESPP